MQIVLIAAVFPLMLAGNELIPRWPSLVLAYNDIQQVYPLLYGFVLWTMVILLFLAATCLYLYQAERTRRRAESDTAINSLSERVKENLRNDLNREMLAKTGKLTEEIEKRKAALVQREKLLSRESHRFQAAEQQVIDRQAEVDQLHYVITLKVEQLNFWLSQIDCAIQALVEDHEAVDKISAYLEGWVNMATTDPQRFTTGVAASKFDLKRFERCKRQLSNIYDRYAEIQRELGNTAQILNKGGYNEHAKK